MQAALVLEPLNGLEKGTIINAQGPDGGKILFSGEALPAEVITRRLGGVRKTTAWTEGRADETNFRETGPAEGKGKVLVKDLFANNACRRKENVREASQDRLQESHPLAEAGYFVGVVIDFHFWGVRPQPLDIVEIPDGLVEDVNDDIGVIHEDPSGRLFPLDAEGQKAAFFHAFFDGLSNALDLPVGVAAADDGVVGEGGHLLHVQYNDILRLFFKGRVNAKKDFFPGIVFFSFQITLS
jgi:hypothetical protein